jgi:hypothetical protein
MRQFMTDVQKMIQLTNKVLYAAQNQAAVNSLYSASNASKNQFNKLLHMFHKLNNMLQRSVESIMRAMGAAGQAFMRGLSILAETLGPIISFATSAITFVGGLAVKAFETGTWLMRWFWDKMVGLGDAMLDDFLQASGSFSSIAGLRAWRATFGKLLDDPNIITNTTIARGAASSQQFAALQILGIKNIRDTSDMMVQITIAARQFMGRQPRGFELRMAQASLITSLINPTALARLQEMQDEEFNAYVKLYQYYKPFMKLSEKAVKGWMRFSWQVKSAGAQITAVIAETLTSSAHPFTQALTSLSKAIVHFVKEFAESKAMKHAVDLLSEWITKFIKFLRDPESEKAFKDEIATLGDIVEKLKDIVKLLAELYKIVGLPTFPRRAGRPVVPGAPGGLVRDPRTGQLVAPGRMVKDPRTGQYYTPSRRPGAVRRGDVGAPYREPPLKAPSTPAEAPETLAEAAKGGYIRTEGTGLYDRSGFERELAASPALRAKVQAIAIAEGGSSSEAQTAVVESMMNRARTRHQSLEQVARWSNEPGGYYAAGGKSRGEAAVRGSAGAIANGSINRALGGSRIVGPATDNSSNIPGNNLADRDIASGKFKLITKMPNGEYYFTRNSENKAREALERQGGDSGKILPFRTQDIPGMPGNAAEQNAASKGNESTSTAGGVSPDAVKAVGGKDPEAFIVHHTGGQGTAEGVVNTLRQRGLGVQYVMERDGTIKQIGGPGAANIMPEARYRQSPILGQDRPFLQNSNIVGMEVIALDDKDVTPAQVAAARKFIAEKYPNTPVFGHGEVNPGHKEADEGMTIVNAIRGDRAAGRGNARLREMYTPKYAQPPAWPEGGRAKPWDDDLGPQIRVQAPRVKVTNLGDDDVAAAKSTSDNDNGEAKALAAGEAVL